ncbi:hypothetical protein L218DRAFT_799713, partial [Marasmius fiardii PR-910]
NIPLPARGERNAPKFDTEYEEQLPIFFDEYENIARAVGITADNQAMKQGCLRYVDAATTCFWCSLDSYKKENITWNDFKKEVISNYPGGEQVPQFTLEELRKVVTEHTKLGIDSSKSLVKYHRDFSTMAASLMDNGVLSAVQASREYVEVFSSSVRTRLDTRLQVQYPAKKQGEAFTLAELKSALDYLLSDASMAMLPFYVAKDSQSIRAVNATVGDKTVHCILDSGCSIVAMSDAACFALHITFDKSFWIPVQSANGDTDWTLGLARNVPFKFGDVTAFLQVHVVPSPTYDVLLGHLFDILMQSIVRNFLSEDQLIISL